MRPAREAGGVALTTLFAGFLVAGLGVLVAGGVASLGEAAARARTAADAAALAGAGTSPLVGGDGADPCETAAELARANGAALETCRAGADALGPGSVVTVTVAASPAAALPGLPERVRARAAAALRPAER